MTATIVGCKVGFSDDIQRNIPRECAKCGAVTNRWFPRPGLWLCPTCFIITNSTDLAKLKKEEAHGKANKNEKGSRAYWDI